MSKTYAGFGLQVRSAFSLPGMAPTREGTFPSVTLELEAPAQLEAAWSGSSSPTPWQGTLGDGQALTIQWGTAGDLLFTYGERAMFHLDPDFRRLGCAPHDRATLDWQRVLITRVLPNVSLACGHEALHAGAVETPQGVIAIAAPSGMGKSTLASELVRRGWPLFADDTVVLGRSGQSVVAYPGSPHTNLPGDSADPDSSESLGAVLGTLAGERWIAVRNASREPRPIAAIVLLERRPGAQLAAQSLPASPLTLAPYMLGLPDEEGRAAERFILYSDLVESASLLRLTAEIGDRPADLADTLELTLGLEQTTMIRGAA